MTGTLGKRPMSLAKSRNHRGVKIASRLANLYADRFIAFAFLAVGYMPPQPQFNLEVVLAMVRKQVRQQ